MCQVDLTIYYYRHIHDDAVSILNELYIELYIYTAEAMLVALADRRRD